MSLIEWSVALEALPGQKESGDRYLVKTTTGGILMAVVDGLGHGPDAADSAERAIAALEHSASSALISLVQACHHCLQGTRGAVLSMAFLNAADDTMTWLGVGNVEGVLLRREGGNFISRQEALLLRGGVLGDHLPQISASVIPVNYGDVLIFATDGVKGPLAENVNMNASTQQIARDIIERHWRKTDDVVVLVARYVHKSNSRPQN